MRTAFVADMHLKPGRQPRQNRQLGDFLAGLRSAGEGGAERLVMLGDIFNGWFERNGRIAGDYADILAIFREAVAGGLEIFHICGNRDFGFARGLPLPSYAKNYGHPGGWAYGGYLRGCADRGGVSALARTGVHLCGLELRLWQDGQLIHCAHGDQFCLADWGHQMLRWWLMSLTPRMGAAYAPFPVLAGIIGLAQGRDVFPHFGVIPYAKNISDVVLKPLIESGVDLVCCGHFHRREERIVQGETRTGRLIIFKCWSNVGAYGVLQDGELKMMQSGD